MVAGLMAAVALGLCGSGIGHRLRVPAGPLTGGILGVGTVLAIIGFPELRPPSELGQLLQVLVGVLVGIRLDRRSVALLPRYLLPATLVAASFVVAGFFSSLYLTATTTLDTQTALFAALPGGMTEMVAIGITVGADGPTIVAVHLVRLFSVLLVLNILLAFFRKRRPGLGGQRTPAVGDVVQSSPHESESGGRLRLCLSIGAGALTGVVGILTGFPAGGVIGAMVGSAAARLYATDYVPMKRYQTMVQVGAGLLIGFQVNEEFFRSLAEVGGAAAIITGIHLLVWSVAFCMLWKLTTYGMVTSVFAASPGGLTELSATAGSVGADAVKVALTHMTRVTFIVALAPLLVPVASGW